jgi:hypothetical protein
VNRLVALLIVAFAVAAYLRSRRSRPAQDYSPADELRTKLAESRATTDESTAESTLEHDLESRRREVHDRARGSIDELS